MNSLLTVFFCINSLFCPIVIFFSHDVLSLQRTEVFTTSITLNNLSKNEISILYDVNFRVFLSAWSYIEERDCKFEKYDRKTAFQGALQGIEKFGIIDPYAEFVPTDNEKKFDHDHIDGESGTAVTSRSIGDDIIYISVREFTNATVTGLDRVARYLSCAKIKPKGILLDLRGDLGGITSDAQDLLSYFVKSGVGVFSFREFGNTPTSYSTMRNPSFHGKDDDILIKSVEFLKKIPIVILIDGNTASASEITIMALKELRGAKLVGSKTYGKGVYQDFVEFVPLGRVKITEGQWFSPSGTCVQGAGIEPDFKVMTSGKIGTLDDVALMKAVEVLGSMIFHDKP